MLNLALKYDDLTVLKYDILTLMLRYNTYIRNSTLYLKFQ